MGNKGNEYACKCVQFDGLLSFMFQVNLKRVMFHALLHVLLSPSSPVKDLHVNLGWPDGKKLTCLATNQAMQVGQNFAFFKITFTTNLMILSKIVGISCLSKNLNP